MHLLVNYTSQIRGFGVVGYCRKMAQKAEISAHQQKTVMEIAELMSAGKQVIYIDESQFHKQLL